MFVRIVRGNNEAVYECGHVRSSYDPEKQRITFVMEDMPNKVDALVCHVDKNVNEAVGVYYMNNRGQTIDTVFRKDEG